MNGFSMRVRALATTAIAALSLLNLPDATFAQTTAAASPAPENGDIIVTATKREESLQKVPISIQALSTKKLEQYNIANFSDFSRLLPSVAYQTTQPGQTTVYMRGVASGGDGNHSGPLPSVGVYLDEQPVTTIGGTLDVHIYDVQRIEALAGPQGTLYGASSESGTIRIISNKPDTKKFYGGVDGDLKVGKNEGVGGKAEGFVNVPLSNTAALRVVGWYQHDAGFINNVPGNYTFIGSGIKIDNAALVKKNVNSTDIAGGRAALKVDLNENWTVTPTIMGQDSRARGPFGYNPKVGDLSVQRYQEDYTHDRFIQAALTIHGKLGNFDVTYAGSYLDRKIDSISDYSDYAIQYDQAYSSVGGIAGYFAFTDKNGNQVNPIQKIVGADHFTKHSEELRVASPASERMRFVAGMFYQRQTHLIHQDYQVAGLDPDLSVNGSPGTLWLTQQNRVDRDYAAFGDASFDITPDLTASGGLRGFISDNSLIGFFGFGLNPNASSGAAPNAAYSSKTGVVACFKDSKGNYIPGAVPGSPCTNLGVQVGDTVVPKDTQEQGLTHKLNLTWRADRDHMIYATWSRGFRPGGINRRGTLGGYQSDYLTNYEIGLKTNWFERMLRLNVTGYVQKWKNFQYAYLGANSFTEVHNGPNATIKGIEADFALTPMRGLTLSGAGAYTDAKIDQNLCAYSDLTFSCTVAASTGESNYISAPSGTKLPVTPLFKANATLRYEQALGDKKAHIQGTIVHSSSAASDIRTKFISSTGTVYNPAADTGRLAPYNTFDFAIGLDFKTMTTEFFINNAFDERAQVSRGTICGTCFTRPQVYVGTPRTVGVKLGTKF